MILAYRYIRDKRRAKKEAQLAAEQQPEEGVQMVQIQPGPDGLQQNTPTSASSQPAIAAPKHSGLSSATKFRILLMIALCVPVIFETLDYTVVATAQVHIASVFNSLDLQSYIGTVYLLTSTVFLPLFGSLADVMGRHWSLQLALVFFLVGSAISTGSQNMATMLVGRGIAGIGAAGMTALVRIISSDANSLDDNNWQQSMLFFLFTIGYCIGPVIGGALTTVSFRWIFAINLPCATLAIILCFLILRGRTKGPQAKRHTLPTNLKPEGELQRETFSQKMMSIDWIGAVLFMIAGIPLLLALNWGSTYGWGSARVIACFVIAGVFCIIWVGWEYLLERKQLSGTTSRNPLMRTDPMIPLEIFRSLDQCIAQYAIGISGMVMIVMFYFVAIFFTIVGGLTGTQAGTQLLYFAPGLGSGAITSIILIKSFRQPKIPIVIGGVILTVGLGMVSYGIDRNLKSYINGFLVMTGHGVGMSIGPLAIHCRFTKPNHVAIVAALTLFSRALGGTIGLAQCGAVLNSKVNSMLTALVSSGTLSSSDAGLLSSGLSSGISSLDSIDSLPPAIQQAVKDAFQQGTRWAIISLIPWAGVAALATFFLSNISEPAKEDGGPVQNTQLSSSASASAHDEKQDVDVRDRA